MSWPDRSTPPIFLLYATIGGGQGISLIAHPILHLSLPSLSHFGRAGKGGRPPGRVHQPEADRSRNTVQHPGLSWVVGVFGRVVDSGSAAVEG